MIRDIAIYLDGSSEDDQRIEYAARLARMLDAHLTGLVANVMFEMPVAFDGASVVSIPDVILAENDAQAAKRVERARMKLDETGLRNELRRVDAFPGEMASALTRHVRTSDLFVGSLPHHRSATEREVSQAVLFDSGRACLFVPPGHEVPAKIDTALVAWKETREAARAVAEALPLLEHASTVVLAVVEEHGAAEQFGDDVTAYIGRYLSRHGIKADIRKINGWESASEALANEQRQVMADLVVMGGYGHSRFREWAIGGVTRDFLSSASVPVLMAH
jgi:nucleotide-binding universal stress UspA family protein